MISPTMMRLAGLFVPGAKRDRRDDVRVHEPFVVDSGRIEREFGLLPTPVDEGIRRTVAWYRNAGR